MMSDKEVFKGSRLFLNIPAFVAYDENLSDKAILLFGEIYSMLNVTGNFYMSNQAIASRIRVKTARSVKDYLRQLEERDYIKRIVKRDVETNQVIGRSIVLGDGYYKALQNPDPGEQKDPEGKKIPEGGVSSSREGGGAKLPEGGGAKLPLNRTYIKEHINKTKEDIPKSTPRKRESAADHHKEERKKIVQYLNSKLKATGSGKGMFRPNADGTKKLINGRLGEGYSVQDFYTVIDNKVAEWRSSPKMVVYLKPSTLFAKSHFEDYLNQQPVGVIQKTTKAKGYQF